MQLNQQPPKPELIIASGAGAAATIPASVPVDTGRATQLAGFPPETRLDPVAGGVPPDGLDMNGLLKLISGPVRWICGGGRFQYDATWAGSTNVAGYPKGAAVLNTDGTGTWLNLVDGNTTNPDTGGANWVQTWLSGTTAANGYVVLPVVVGTSVVRFIVQWATGVPSGTGDGPQTITLPTAYSTAVLHVGVTTQGSASSLDDAMFQLTSTTLTSVTLYKQNFNSSNLPVVTPKIFTIGY